jgi:hypothetical protein
LKRRGCLDFTDFENKNPELTDHKLIENYTGYNEKKMKLAVYAL